MMKRIAISLLTAILYMTSWGNAQAKYKEEPTMRQLEDGTYKINTTHICHNIFGFNGTTPLNVYIKDDQIVKIEALENLETPNFFEKITEQLIPSIIGLFITKKDNKIIFVKDKNDEKGTKVDAVTGATYTSDAVITNVAQAAIFYMEHK